MFRKLNILLLSISLLYPYCGVAGGCSSKSKIIGGGDPPKRVHHPIPRLIEEGNGVSKDMRGKDATQYVSSEQYPEKFSVVVNEQEGVYFAPTIQAHGGKVTVEGRSEQNILLQRPLPQNVRQINPDERIILQGLDGRERIQNTQEFPYRFHGHLLMTFGQDTFSGSGTLVGPNHVLTAAHNLYALQRGLGEYRWASKIIFIPGQDERNMPYGMSYGSIFMTHKNWYQKHNLNQAEEAKKYDIGMVVLEDPIGYKTGWSGLLCATDQMLSNVLVNVTGYPGDKGDGPMQGMQMWKMSNQIKHFSPEVLRYHIDTYGGQSGSSLGGTGFQGVPEGYYTVGVHVRGVDRGNEATRLSVENFNLVLEWIKKYQIKGLKLHFNSDIQDIIKQADEGDIALQRLVGKNFMDGSNSFPVNIEKALYYLNLATNAGDGNASIKLGVFYAKEKNYSEAKKYLAIGAQRGDVNGYHNLGLLERDFQNYEEAEKYLLLSAKHHNRSDSYYELGQMFWDNNQETKGLSYLKKAADMGHLSGIFNYAVTIKKKDPEESFKYFQMAADKGDASAENQIGIAYFQGIVVGLDYKKAFEYFERSAQKGYDIGISHLALMYDQGLGVKENREKAISLYKEAAKLGNQDAKKALLHYGQL